MENKSTFIKLIKNKDTDACLFLYGIFIAVGITLLFIVSSHFFPSTLGICPFKFMTGIDCPGCGGTRAFVALLHGDIVASFLYHPFIIYAAAVTLIFYIGQLLRFITHERVSGVHFRTVYVIIGAGILAINWIVRIILHFI